MAREWVDTPSFLSHLLQKCFNAGLVPFDASNLNIKQFWLCCIISTFHPVSCVTRFSSPSCVGWMKGPAARMLLGWRGASTDTCCGCGNSNLMVGCIVKKLVGMFMKVQEPLPKQAKILVQRIFQVEECCYPTHSGFLWLWMYLVVSWHVWAHVENRMVISNYKDH